MSSAHVLILDDSADTRIFLKTLVTSLGYCVHESKSGAEAIKILSENKINLLLFDILVQNTEVSQFLEVISKYRQTQGFKVAVLLGTHTNLDKSKWSALKPDETILKTLDSKTIKETIHKLIAKNNK